MHLFSLRETRAILDLFAIAVEDLKALCECSYNDFITVTAKMTDQEMDII